MTKESKQQINFIKEAFPKLIVMSTESYNVIFDVLYQRLFKKMPATLTTSNIIAMITQKLTPQNLESRIFGLNLKANIESLNKHLEEECSRLTEDEIEELYNFVLTMNENLQDAIKLAPAISSLPVICPLFYENFYSEFKEDDRFKKILELMADLSNFGRKLHNWEVIKQPDDTFHILSQLTLYQETEKMLLTIDAETKQRIADLVLEFLNDSQ